MATRMVKSRVRDSSLSGRKPMQLIYTHENNILVGNARNLLSQHGLESILKNEFAGSGAGELSTFDTWQELWVSDEDYLKAKEVLAVLSDSLEGERWVCEGCGEVNEPTFHSCWNCQRARA